MKKTISLAVVMMFMLVLMAGVALSADEKAAEQMQNVSITGTINDANQLVDNDGQTFNVVDNEEGKKLLTHAGQKAGDFPAEGCEGCGVARVGMYDAVDVRHVTINVAMGGRI